MLTGAEMQGIGAILGGIGSIGGLFGSRGGDGIDVSENVRLNTRLGDVARINAQRALPLDLTRTKALTRQATREATQQTMKSKIAMADKFGFHRLYALGQPVSPGQPIAVGESTSAIAGQSGQGSHWGDAISDFGNAVRDYGASKRQEKFDQVALQTQQALAYKYAAEGKSSEIETDLAVRAYKDSVDARNAQKANSQQDLPPLYVQFRDTDGKAVTLLNPETGIQPPETIGLGYWLDAKGKDGNKGEYGPTDYKVAP